MYFKNGGIHFIQRPILIHFEMLIMVNGNITSVTDLGYTNMQTEELRKEFGETTNTLYVAKN